MITYDTADDGDWDEDADDGDNDDDDDGDEDEKETSLHVGVSSLDFMACEAEYRNLLSRQGVAPRAH